MTVIDPTSSSSSELGNAAADENRTPALVVAGEGDVTRCNLLEIVVEVCIFSLVLLQEKH
jgi:heptaprenylglyceryl phosphate synthase